VLFRKKKPQPPKPTVVLEDGDTMRDANGNRFIVARVPETPEGVTVGVMPLEPPAEFRWLAARTMALYASYLGAGFPEDMARDLLWSRLEWELHG
jgi:hypothetical protein